MKVMLSGLLWCLLVLAAPARAAVQAQPSSSQGGEQKQVSQAIAKQQVTVKQLQGDLDHEESRSRQADAKLKEQDQAIAALQKQIEALKTPPRGVGR